MIVDENDLRDPFIMDARDVTSPFTPGALRGGTHRHEWSGDGKWIGFTYNDALMKILEDKTGERWNLRTIGVAKPIKPVIVDENQEVGNHSGEWFTVLVVRVVPDPLPGSDEISHAAGDGWVGHKGYLKNGDLQRARAFIGKVRSQTGEDVDEVFIVDIPDDITIAGEFGSLEGTVTTFPTPPYGTVQRRLTYTAETDHPGCEGIVRTSKDGTQIAYLAKEKNGISQVFIISPFGGDPKQVTFHLSNVQGNLRWSPDDKHITYIWDNSIIVHDIERTTFKRLTRKTPKPPGNLVWSHDGKTIAFNRDIVHSNGERYKQVFTISIGKTE